MNELVNELEPVYTVYNMFSLNIPSIYLVTQTIAPRDFLIITSIWFKASENKICCYRWLKVANEYTMFHSYNRGHVHQSLSI